jgi:dephospho-CoA kinase
LHQGRIDRSALARIVFNRSGDLKKLCNLIHPVVILEIKNFIKKSRFKKQKGFLVVDAPLLFESGLHEVCNCVIVVRADMASQIKRIQKKSRLTKTDITKRVKAQMPMAAKIKRADVVIDNRGNIKQTKKQVEELWQYLKKVGK